MKSCVIYSNCQADGLATFLPLMGFGYRITVYRNYQLILKEQKLDDLERDAKVCDLFIYQPTNDKHGDSSSENVLATIPKEALSVSFAYVFNHGMFPLINHGSNYMGADFMDSKYWKLQLPELKALYFAGLIDFALWPRFTHCLAEQARRERDCDIKLTKWMTENRHRRILLAVNHPSTIMFLELSRMIMQHLGIPISPVGEAWGENHIGLPCTLPHSGYISREYGMERAPDPEALDFYWNWLVGAWQQKQQ